MKSVVSLEYGTTKMLLLLPIMGYIASSIGGKKAVELL